MILTALCLALIPAATPQAAQAPPTPQEGASPVLLARLPRLAPDGREQFVGGGADPGGRLLLVLGNAQVPQDSIGNPLFGQHIQRPLDERWLQADGAGQVTFCLPPAAGLSVQLWREGSATRARGQSRCLTLARRLNANYGGPAAVISEFMKDPTDVTDSHGEWVEITNLQPWRLNLEGWVLSDDGSNHALLGGGSMVLRCGPGGTIVIGGDMDPATNGGVTMLGDWSSFTLSNGADEIILSNPDGVIVDRVAYDGGTLWPDSAGQSIQLDPSALDVSLNDDAANWCHAQDVWPGGTTDTGSPGMPNTSCP